MISKEPLTRFFRRKSDTSPKSETFPKPEKQNIYAGLLPYDIRYALQYKQGDVNASEVLSLSRNWVNEAVYAAIKITASDLPAQEKLLSELCTAFVRDMSTEEIGQILEKNLSRNVGTANIRKLAEVSRMGSDLFQEIFLDTMKAAVDKNPDSSLLFLAYTSFIALREIVAYAQKKEVSVFFVVPEWLDDDQIKIMGYEFNGKTLEVHQILKEKPVFIPSQVSIVDDSIKTGESYRKMQRYWKSHFNQALDESHLFVGKVLK